MFHSNKHPRLPEHMNLLKLLHNYVNSSWELIAEPTVYNNEFVSELNVYKRQLFIITDRGLKRMHMEKQFLKHYTYPFIGNVNDFYVTGDRLWLATDNGLIQFSWKKDL